MTDNPDYDNDPGSYPPLVPEPNPFDRLVAGLPDPKVTLEDEEQARLEAIGDRWAVKIEVRPASIPPEVLERNADEYAEHGLEGMLWQCRITTAGGASMMIIGGEHDGPFKAAQRAIDKHAFGVEIT